MKINDYLNKNYYKLLLLFKKITHNHQNAGDLLNDCILNFLLKGDVYCNQVLEDDKVDNYLSKMAKTQYNSKTSPFHFTYRNPNHIQELPKEVTDLEDKRDEELDVDKMASDINVYIGSLNIYERTIASRHFGNGDSQRSLSKEYNINRIHISRTVNEVRSTIQQKFKKENYERD